MSAEMYKFVEELLKTYPDRERKIAVLQYNLAHPVKVSKSEQIEAMTYGRGDGLGYARGHVSNKTLYIALNYEEQAEHMNVEAANEISDELFELEHTQKRLRFYINLLGKRQADIIRLVYLSEVPAKEVADQYGVTVRTVDRIKKAAIEALAGMYEYAENYKG